MDAIDKQLLTILTENASYTATEIGAMIHLSIPAINKRISKLKAAGIIERFTIQVDPKKIGKSVQAIIMLVVDKYPQVQDLYDFINSQKDVMECYAVTGEYDYMVRICTRDIDSLEELLLKLKEIHCVARSHTMFVLMEHKRLIGPLPD